MSYKDPNVEYNKSYENMHKKTQGGKLLPGHPDYNKSGYDAYGNRGSGTSSGCFPPGTSVWTPHGFQNIEDIKAGDRIWSMSPGGDLEAKEVLMQRAHRSQRLWVLELDGADPVRTTSVHSFWSGGRWRQAQHLRKGETISRLDEAGILGDFTVLRSGPSQQVSEVFNLIVDTNFNFFAEGAFVHTFTRLRFLRVFVWRALRRLSKIHRPRGTTRSLGKGVAVY